MNSRIEEEMEKMKERRICWKLARSFEFSFSGAGRGWWVVPPPGVKADLAA